MNGEGRSKRSIARREAQLVKNKLTDGEATALLKVWKRRFSSSACSAATQAWGFAAFRPGQREHIDAILVGESCFLTLETSGGKTFISTSAAFVRALRGEHGTVVLLVPTVALIEQHTTDLKNAAERFEGASVAVASDRSNHVTQRAAELMTAVKEQERRRTGLTILVMLPETFLNLRFVELASLMLVLDEAHLWHTWSGFRPLQQFQSIQGHLPRAQIILVSAVNPPSTRKLLAGLLGMSENAAVIGKPVIRENLRYIIHPLDRLDAIGRDLLAADRFPAIWYVRSYEDGIRLRARFGEWERKGLFHGVVDMYAGLMSDQHKAVVLDRLRGGEIQVVIASNALGMGVDIRVATVVIYGNVTTVDDAINSWGRAGRTGLPSLCYLLFDSSTLSTCSPEFQELVGAGFTKPAGAKVKQRFVCNLCNGMRWTDPSKPPSAPATTCASIGATCDAQTCLRVCEERYLDGKPLLTPPLRRPGCNCSVCSPLEFVKPELGATVVCVSAGSEFYGQRGVVIAPSKATLMQVQVNVLFSCGRSRSMPFSHVFVVAPEKGDKFRVVRKLRTIGEVDAQLHKVLLDIVTDVAASAYAEAVEVVPMALLDLVCRTLPDANDQVWLRVDERVRELLIAAVRAHRRDHSVPPTVTKAAASRPSKQLKLRDGGVDYDALDGFSADGDDGAEESSDQAWERERRLVASQKKRK
jgi:superfamily II DNA/RNA helicase